MSLGLKGSNLPTGIKIIAGVFVLFNAVRLALFFPELMAIEQLAKALEHSQISIVVFVLMNVVHPMVMAVCGIGLWYCKPWAWWICVIIEGLAICNKAIYAFLVPSTLFGVYPLKENASTIIAIAILVYCFNEKIFRLFRNTTSSRPKAFAIVAASSVALSLLIMSQTIEFKQRVGSILSTENRGAKAATYEYVSIVRQGV